MRLKKTNAVGNEGYIFTLKDINGVDIGDSTFSYDLLLPNYSGKGNVEVEYAEIRSALLGENFEGIVNKNSIDALSNVVLIKNLNHFTIFVVTNTNSSSTYKCC
ncbi:MAG: hypothetical protein Q9M91_03005 [Candidatus Dojkabacteria bacterium]|nr:hypothetical protein [Candidatus Dojkabacteria bacterium]